jgi:hypothetical protein
MFVYYTDPCQGYIILPQNLATTLCRVLCRPFKFRLRSIFLESRHCLACIGHCGSLTGSAGTLLRDIYDVSHSLENITYSNVNLPCVVYRAQLM